jgi:hypothetical protein
MTGTRTKTFRLRRYALADPRETQLIGGLQHDQDNEPKEAKRDSGGANHFPDDDGHEVHVLHFALQKSPWRRRGRSRQGSQGGKAALREPRGH